MAHAAALLGGDRRAAGAARLESRCHPSETDGEVRLEPLVKEMLSLAERRMRQNARTGGVRAPWATPGGYSIGYCGRGARELVMEFPELCM